MTQQETKSSTRWHILPQWLAIAVSVAGGLVGYGTLRGRVNGFTDELDRDAPQRIEMQNDIDELTRGLAGMHPGQIRAQKDAAAAELRSIVDMWRPFPPGTIIAYGGTITNPNQKSDGGHVPDGWLLCDGSPVGKEHKYKNLRELLKHTGWARQGTAICVPDLRGLFLRGVDDPDGPADDDKWKAAKNDPEWTKRDGLDEEKPETYVGSVQEDAFQVHKHQYSNAYVIKEGGGGANGIRWGEEFKARSDDRAMTSKIIKDSPDGPKLRAGNETRPKNAYVNFIIKY